MPPAWWSLFADLLQARLHQAELERVAQLLGHAAEWRAQDGQVAEAACNALAARDYARAADLVATYWGTVAGTGVIETVSAWLTGLPEDVTGLVYWRVPAYLAWRAASALIGSGVMPSLHRERAQWLAPENGAICPWEVTTVASQYSGDGHDISCPYGWLAPDY